MENWRGSYVNGVASCILTVRSKEFTWLEAPEKQMSYRIWYTRQNKTERRDRVNNTPGSYSAPKSATLTKVLRGFHQSLQANAGIVP
jgi:hypothetical protein